MKAQLPPKLLWPLLIWFTLFLWAPLAIILVYSFCSRGVYGGVVFEANLENFRRAFQWIYLSIFWMSLKTAFITSVLTFVIGYPLAYLIATSSKFLQRMFILLLMVPFWTNFVVRAFATKSLFSPYGLLQQFLFKLGIIQELVFVPLEIPLWVGMLTNYLPFMVLPLYVALEKFDFSLIEAAKDLGASSFQIFFKVLIPLTKSGIFSGFLFVFTPVLGEFVIPDMMGSGQFQWIGHLITDQFLKSRDWAFGSALSLLLLIMILGLVIAYLRSSDPVKANQEPIHD